MRIGHGYDVHAFGAGTGVTLGGVFIPYDQGLEAHSDGDVVLHALSDAILGAATLGDIGRHFPDSDARYCGISSVILLREVTRLARQHHWQIGNADMTVVCQAPRLAPFLDDMCQHIADALDCQVDRVNVKATTTERLGFAGRGEGIACHAVVLLEPASRPG